MKENKQHHKEEWVEGFTPPTYSFLYMYNLLCKKTFSSILYVLVGKGYSYRKEMDKILNHDSRGYINKLKKDQVIEETRLSDDEKEKLKLALNLTEHHIGLMTCYRLTNNFMTTLQNPMYYRVMTEMASTEARVVSTELERKYNAKMAQKKEDERQYREKVINKAAIVINMNIKGKSIPDGLLGYEELAKKEGLYHEAMDKSKELRQNQDRVKYEP